MKLLKAVALVVIALGCQKAPAQAVSTAAGTQAPPGQTDQQTPVAVKPVPAELPTVIARVNGEDIGRDEFERAVKSVETRAGGPVPAERRDEIYRNILDQLVAYRLLAQESSVRKLNVTDAEIDARIGKIREQFPSDEAYQKALGDRQLTLAKLREDTTIDVRIAKMLEAEIKDAPISETAVSDFYSKNPEEFKEAERLRASHILIRVAPEADAAAKTKARAEAQGVLKRARAGGDFSALAKEHSQDVGSAANGGDLGFFVRGQMVPEFEAAAFALQPGAISGVVETQFGFHVIKAIERRDARTVPLAEVSGQIQEFLKERGRKEQTDAFVGRLKAKGKVEVFI